jgi:hypothetical protein
MVALASRARWMVMFLVAFAASGFVESPALAQAAATLFVPQAQGPIGNSVRTMLVQRLPGRGYALTDVSQNADVSLSIALSTAPARTAYDVYGRPQAVVSPYTHAIVSVNGQGRVLGSGAFDFVTASGPSWEQIDYVVSYAVVPRVTDFMAHRTDVAPAGGLPASGAAESGAVSQAAQAFEKPEALLECDGDQCDHGNSGAWIFHGDTGVARWPAGSVADVTITKADPSGFVFQRVDRTSSASPGFSATYYGTQHGGRIEGTVVASWPGHFPNQRPPGQIRYPWFATVPGTTCDPSKDVSTQDMLDAGGLALRFQQKQAAFQCFLKGAQQGDSQSKGLVGLMYRDGIGVDANHAEAFRWLKESAVSGDYNGQVALEQMYELGLGTTPDPKLGQYWRQRAQENPAYVQRQKNEAQAERMQVAQASAQASAQQAGQSLAFVGLAALMLSL